MNFIDTLLTDLSNQTFGDYFVLITGILYVVFAVANRPICWVFGIASTGVLAYMTVAKYHLYADGFLNLFYVVMGIVGLYQWRKGMNIRKFYISNIAVNEMAGYLIGGTILSFLSAYLLNEYTSALSTNLDAFTTIFSMIATVWLVKRYVENWSLWIIVDLAYCYLYYSRGAVLYLVLMIIYTILAFSGLRKWQKILASKKMG